MSNIKDEQAFARARKKAFGRGRLQELERTAVALGDTPEGNLVWDAVAVLSDLRQAIHGGMLEPPVRNWNK